MMRYWYIFFLIGSLSARDPFAQAVSLHGNCCIKGIVLGKTNKVILKVYDTVYIAQEGDIVADYHVVQIALSSIKLQKKDEIIIIPVA